MKKLKKFKLYPALLITLLLLGINSASLAAVNFQDFREYKGQVVDSETGNAIASAFLRVDGTNISTITNAEGEFSLKIPVDITSGMVSISNLGFQSKTIPLDYFKAENTRIELIENLEELSEVAVFTSTDAQALVSNMFRKTKDNYFTYPTIMTAFYREAIKNRRRNVSLSEAVLEIYKKPYTSMGRDEISVIKSRKSVDYERLDTLALKLRGGPFNTLYSDIMKYPEYLFKPHELDEYIFTFDSPTQINNRYLYVVNFESKDKSTPWYYGQLFIDAEKNSLVKAAYNLNVDNRSVAADMFVRRKPSGARVYPVSVRYEIDYRESDDNWYYGYGRAELEFVVNWRRKLFNTRYTVTSEMAVTDWDRNLSATVKRDDSFINHTVVMADDVSGFTDAQFWGDNNIIEPDKSIQNAIDKIQQQLRKN